MLADDLVTKGVDEPYRLFTSRSEYRLLLRQDNADLRLTEKGLQYGLISPQRAERFLDKKAAVEAELSRLRNCRPSQEQLAAAGIEALPGSDLASLMQRPELDYAQVSQAFPSEQPLVPQAAEQVDISLKYAGYIKKQEEQVERFRNLENKRLPEGTDYLQIRGLSVESAQKLNKRQPQSCLLYKSRKRRSTGNFRHQKP